MASSSINTALLLLLTSYFGIVHCTMEGNADRSCGGTSCPPAVNAPVTLAVKKMNIVLGQTTTNAVGGYSFNLNHNATYPAPVTRHQVNNVVVYVPLPVANCAALTGAGILHTKTSARIAYTATGPEVMFVGRRLERV